MTKRDPFRSCNGCVGMLVEGFGMLAIMMILVAATILAPMYLPM